MNSFDIADQAIRLTQELIAIPSESSEPIATNEPCEARIVEILQRICTANSIPWELQEVLPGRLNFIVSFPKPEAQKILILAHMDTVSGKEMTDAFQGKIRDGKIWGRGACDDKGPLAVLFSCLIGLKNSGNPLAYDVTVVGSVDEECSMAGSAKMAQKNPAGWDLCLALEPSLLRPISSHIGVYRCRILPELSPPATSPLPQINTALKSFKAQISEAEHPKLGKAIMTITEIKGDDNKTVAGQDRVLVDIRLLPNQSPAKIHASIKKIIGDLGHVIPLFTGLGIDSDPKDPLIRAFQDSLSSQGLNNELIGVPFPSDCSQLRNRGTCLVWGPGDPHLAHSPNECIEIGQIKGACRVLTHFLCRPSDEKNSATEIMLPQGS